MSLEMAQGLKAFGSLGEDQRSVPSTRVRRLTTTGDSSSRGFYTLFLPLWVFTHTCKNNMKKKKASPAMFTLVKSALSTATQADRKELSMGHAKTQPGFCLETGGRDSSSEALGNTGLLQAGGQILNPARSYRTGQVSSKYEGERWRWRYRARGNKCSSGKPRWTQMWGASGNSLALLSLRKS